MKNFNLLSGLLIALIFAGYTLDVDANPHHKGPHDSSHGMEHGMEHGMTVKRVMRHLGVLDLTDEQRGEIKSLVKAGIEQSKPQRDALHVMHGKMKKLMHADVADEAAIKSLAAEMANIKSDLMILHINKRQQVAVLLNDEQRAELKKIKHQRMMTEHE
jgi:protein CpxP